MTTLPPLPVENEDPWFEKRQAFDIAVKNLLEGPVSPENIAQLFSSTIQLTAFQDVGDLLVGSDSEGGAYERLPHGLDGQILESNSLEPFGLRWSDRLTETQTAAQDAINLATETALEAVRSVITEYAVNNSETTAPTTGWSTDQPARLPGEFIWFRTITTKGPIADEEVITSEPALLTGNTGAPGDPGSPGSPGVGIASTVIEYQVGSSGTSVPGGAWSTSVPSTTVGQFLWTRTVVTYTNATSSTSYSVAAHGSTGSAGSPGRGISSTEIRYQAGSSGTTAPTGTWLSSPPATTTGQFLWTRTVVTYTDATTSTSYSIAAHGATGSAGANGRGVSSAATTYQVHSNGTTAPTGTWLSSPPATTTGQFLWTRTILTYTDATTSTAYSVAAHGSTGSPGSTGVSVSSITPYFLLQGSGGSTPAKPTLNPPGGSWSLTEPGYTTSTELFRTELVLYSNGTFAYTNVSKVSSYVASTQAVTVANLAQASAQGLIVSSMTDPGHTVGGVPLPGRIWFVLNGSGNTIGIKQSNGSAWTSYTLMADQILVPGSVGPTQIANGAITTVKLSATAIDGMTITGATVQTTATAARGVKIDSSGMKVYNNSGVQTLDINGSTGAITITGTINAAAGTFSGNIALTGTIQASGTTASTVGFYALDTTVNMGTKLVPRGLEFYDNGAIQSVGVKTRKISTGDPLTPGVIALYFEDPIASIALEISQYKFGVYPYSVRVAKPIMFESGVIFASNGALVRRGTSTASEVAFAWVGNGLASNLPTGTNVDTGSLGLVQSSGSTSGGDDGGLYRYTGSAWKPIALSVMPAMYHNGIDGSAPSISANTWTLVGNVALGSPRFVQGFQSYPSGALTIAKKGIYLISYSLILLTAPTSFNTRVTKNSTSPGTDSVSVVSRNDTNTANTVASAIVELDVGDVLRLYAYSTSSSTIRALPQTNYSVVMIAPL